MSTSIRWSFNWSNWSPSPQQFRQAISFIQPEEKQRLGRFVFRKDVRASLAGRLLIRKFINDHTEIPYRDIKISRDENNKPCLENTVKSPLLFNVSHQGSYTVLAGEINLPSKTAGDLKLGVDVMKLEYSGGKKLSEFFRIMDRNFSKREWEEIRYEKFNKETGVGEKERERFQIEMFCRHWALKESYVKAIGVGIVVDLRSLDFCTKSKLIENEVIRDTVLFIDGNEADWVFEETIFDGHCVAVAMPKTLREGTDLVSGGGKFEELSYEDLVRRAGALFEEDDKYCDDYFLKSEKP